MIDLYKAYLADIESIGSRYSTANTFYMTVVSALLGVIAFADGSKPFGSLRVELVIAIALFAIVICWIWWKTINFYSLLFFAKFEVLRTMEAELPFKPFIAETKILTDHKVEWLLQNERRVPKILGAFFVVLMLLALLKGLLVTARA
jgi:hypothetical protein